MRVHVQFPAAHGPIQQQIMYAFKMRKLREMWCPCATKFGKTLAGSVLISNALLNRRQGMFRWIAPIYQQALIAKRYCDRMLPGEPVVTSRDSGHPQITVPSLESTLQFWHGQNPVDLEGEGTHGNVIDECAKQKEAVYESVRTTVSMTGGWIAGLSTPLGKGWFYQRCMYAKQRMLEDLKKGKVPEYIYLTAPTAANPHVPIENILDAQKRLIDRLFRQYYLSQFLDDGTVFVGIKQVLYGPELEFDPGQREYYIADKDRQVVVGVDWAKQHDYTVFSAFSIDENIPRLVGIYRFQHVKYIQAVKELKRFCSQFKEVVSVFHDQTGVGEALDDLLEATDLPYEGLVFTNETKMALINDLIMGVQTGQILLLNWQVLIDEYDVFEMTVSKLGKLQFGAPSGSHDDIVISNALAYTIAKDMCGVDFEVKTADDVDIEKLRQMSVFERMLSDEDDNDDGIHFV